MGEAMWRKVPNWPDYEVSNLGSVRRLTPGHGARRGFVLATPPDSGGYPVVNIAGQPRRVHVLVAEAFLGPIPAGGEVHHRNENRADPRASNLEVKPSKLAHGEEHRGEGSPRRRHGETNPTIACACDCGRTFPKFDRGGRPRRFVSGHNDAARARRGEVVGNRG